ncbi:hypothetical protein HUB98_03810 [Paenibacillus barcinonensis]|uniref:Uncharacterized protein n=1 Tax=Paenibacillus barcinonensis TaxID=198119 RepID=A0A2V4VS58_PAEBA|nr:hypothetical protein [Paenibacillus barcinonensis]PYE49309.1 hypothetical protein DFQ00_106295 [Paenibacillus barcinonensis]QKS55526.1 hypothetical protein HUB98_03810 [Paenibacillus barcinonensis]
MLKPDTNVALNVQATLEEALSLLDDVIAEAPEALKHEVTTIWSNLDKLVQKTFVDPKLK